MLPFIHFVPSSTLEHTFLKGKAFACLIELCVSSFYNNDQYIPCVNKYQWNPDLFPFFLFIKYIGVIYSAVMVLQVSFLECKLLGIRAYFFFFYSSLVVLCTVSIGENAEVVEEMVV